MEAGPSLGLVGQTGSRVPGGGCGPADPCTRKPQGGLSPSGSATIGSFLVQGLNTEDWPGLVLITAQWEK